MRREALLKSHSEARRGLIGPVWRTMFAFRSKRRKERGNDHGKDRTKPRKSVGSLFFALPAELRIYILRELYYIDILSLRLASRSFHQLIEVNEAQIVRHHIKYHVPRHILELYPPPPELNLKFLTGLAQRQWLSCNMAQHIAEYISKQIQGRYFVRNEHLRSRHLRMRRRLVPLILTLFHFFERYRYRLLAETCAGNTISYGAVDEAIPIQQEIMEAYNPALLLRVSQTYHLLLYLLSQRLAPPSRAFSLAWNRSGRTVDPLFEDEMVKLLIIGGIHQVEKMWSIKNRSRRRKEMVKWLAGLQPHGGRKPGNSAEPRIDKDPGPDGEAGGDSSRAFGDEHTPLALGVPALRLPDSAISRLIPVLPPLRAVWVSSARDLMLAKGLVTADVELWELFIGELVSGDDSESESEHPEDDSDEDPDDSEDESGGMCLAGLGLAEEELGISSGST